MQPASVGRANATDTLFRAGTRLTVRANIGIKQIDADGDGAVGWEYVGLVALNGQHNNKNYRLGPAVVIGAEFASAPIGKTVLSRGDCYLGQTFAYLAFTWVKGKTENRISWTVIAYEDDDEPGEPTGAILWTGTERLNGALDVVLPDNVPAGGG